MNTKEIVKELAIRLNTTQTHVDEILDSVIDTIKSDLEKSQDISIPGIGTFKVRKREKHKSFNPFLKKLMMIPPKMRVMFSPAKALKEEVKDHKL